MMRLMFKSWLEDIGRLFELTPEAKEYYKTHPMPLSDFDKWFLGGISGMIITPLTWAEAYAMILATRLTKQIFWGGISPDTRFRGIANHIMNKKGRE